MGCLPGRGNEGRRRGLPFFGPSRHGAPHDPSPAWAELVQSPFQPDPPRPRHPRPGAHSSRRAAGRSGSRGTGRRGYPTHPRLALHARLADRGAHRPAPRSSRAGPPRGARALRLRLRRGHALRRARERLAWARFRAPRRGVVARRRGVQRTKWSPAPRCSAPRWRQSRAGRARSSSATGASSWRSREPA